VGIFVLLQAGFLSALDAVNLKAGWHNLNLTNVNSPYSSIMEQHKILWLIPILFVAAIIAPLGAALMYCTGGSRSLFGLAVNRCAPKALVRTNKRTIPTLSIWVNLVLGMIIFLFFKGWNTMADLLTCLFAISYSIAPICMLALRFQVPNKKRPLKLPFGLLWAYIAFYICTLFIYWTGWQTIYKLIWFLLACTIIIIIFQIVIKLKSASDSLNWKASIWMWPYFAGLIFFSYIGNYGGGHGLLSDNTIMILLAIFCAVITFLAVVYKLPAHETRAHLNKVEHE
jgi:amino acid transporter